MLKAEAENTMYQLIFVATIFLIGWLLQFSGKFSEDAPLTLNQYVIYVALPALILAQLPSLAFDETIWKVVFIAWFGLLLGALLVLALAKLFAWDRQTTGALLMLVPLGNTSFVGIPMINALIGTKGVPIALIYDQLGSFLGLILYGSWVIAAFAGKSKPTLMGLSQRILSFPPFWALILALALPSFWMQNHWHEPLILVGNTLVPVVLIALGLQFKCRLPNHHYKPLISGLSLKLVVVPFFVLLLVLIMGWQGMAIETSMLESAMAPMISAGALAIAAGLAPELVAALVSWGLIISFITVPIWQIIIKFVL